MKGLPMMGQRAAAPPLSSKPECTRTILLWISSGHGLLLPSATLPDMLYLLQGYWHTVQLMVLHITMGWMITSCQEQVGMRLGENWKGPIVIQRGASFHY